MTGKPFNGSMMPGNLQVKADILENNLYADLAKVQDRSEGHVVIERQQWPDTVIIKALNQLLPRLNINDKSIVYKLEASLRTLAAGKPVQPIKSPVYDRTLTGEGRREISASVSDTAVKLVFSGIPMIKGSDGAVDKYYFNHEDYPGKLLENQSIDFREINRFPVINKGEDMLLVRYEVKGKPGLTFDGQEIPVDNVAPFALTLHEGVTKIEQYGSDGKIRGYLVRAARTGVIIYNKSKLIPDIDVQDQIDIKQLDYSVGNIGTEYVSPINIKVGVVRNGFKVRVNGRVEIDTLDGGSVSTNGMAVIGMVMSRSVVQAQGDIEIKSSSTSTLVSREGKIRVDNELIDSVLTSPCIRFNSTRGLFTNTVVDTEELFVKNVFFCGNNEVHLGRSLLSRRAELKDAQADLEISKNSLRSDAKALQEQLLADFKSVSAWVRNDPESFDRFKRLLQCFQKLDEDNAHALFDALQKKVNVKVIRQARKRFDGLVRLRSDERALELRLEDTALELAAIAGRLNAMRFSIAGFLRPSASIRIFCSSKEKGVVEQPVSIIESDTRGDKRINITGSYSLTGGFQLSR